MKHSHVVKQGHMLLSLITVSLAALTVGAQGPTRAEVPSNQDQQINWNERAPWPGRSPSLPPEAQQQAGFRIFDNVYYVGLKRVSSYLITTSEGLVLIDAAFAQTTDFVLDNVRSMGFDPGDIKYILITHSHADHYGGAARIQALTGARVGMSLEDWEVVERSQSGAQTPPRGPILQRDLILKDGDTLKIGETVLKFYVTPGHTPGATSIEFQANSGGKSYRGLSPGGLGVQFGREWTATFIKSIERLKQLGPWDVLLGNHPFLMPRNLFDIENDLRKRGPGPNPAVLGATVIDGWFDRVLQTAREKLATEQKEPQP